MKLTRNAKAISRLLLILLLLTATIIGAILSYLWVIGAVINLGIRVPEKTTVSITNVTFSSQDTSYFNVTLLNPSYSPSEASILQIATTTQDTRLHNVTITNPPLPYQLPKANEETFRCLWNWASYTGESVQIIAFIEDGSGPTFEAKTPLVNLTITDLRFNSTISVSHFNMTVRNQAESVTYVDIADVAINTEIIPHENVSVPLPYPLNPDESVSFTCMRNWANYQNKSVKVTVYTLQGYMSDYTKTTPSPVILEVSKVSFDIADTSPYFNVTVKNSGDSPTYVNVTEIDATVENGDSLNVTEITPSLPYGLTPGEPPRVFMCLCNWTEYRNENFTIGVHTQQGFIAYHNEVTPPPVVLKITKVQFSPANTTRLNITVANLRVSLENINITHITVTVEEGNPENITETTPSLPYLLHTNESRTFACTWNWTGYGGMNVTFTAYALGYSANAPELVPEPVIVIAKVAFDPADPNHFNVTVKNPPLAPTIAKVKNITVTVEGGIPINMTETNPSLPYNFSYTEVTFTCSWNWTDYLGNKTTVTVTTSQGYVTTYTRGIPIFALINITNVVFGNDTNPYFNVTVLNPGYSLTYAHLTLITVTPENETAQNVTVVGPPYLPNILHKNQSVTFMCSWDWTTHSEEIVIVKVETLEGYEAIRSTPIP